MLRDVLIEVGRTDEAISVMLSLAGIEIDGLDGDGAARTLQDVLLIDPGNERATSMLHELGYELVEEPSSTPDLGEEAGTYGGQPAFARNEPEPPLPSYDLEEIGPEDVSAHSYRAPSRSAAPDGAARGMIDAIDDPFGEGPLPSFPLEPGTDGRVFVAPVVNETERDAYLPPATPSAAPGGTPELESALEEAEFFASRGLHEDARAILEEQLARLPNHPLILERLVELDTQERAAQLASGARPSPVADDDGRGPPVDRAFDIAESLHRMDAAEPTGGLRAEAGPPTEQVDVEEVFAKFKEGVAKQISVDDAQSHYDLGVAYKEMGLFDDAIRELETAARDAKRAFVCHSMIGMIHNERGNLDEAIQAFLLGLEAPERTRDQEAALSYEIGAAYEAKKSGKQALEFFQRAARLAPNYRDVQERIRRLQKTEPKQSMRAAVGADDEFERAFDDILGKN